jgi:hypothetical protein
MIYLLVLHWQCTVSLPEIYCYDCLNLLPTGFRWQRTASLLAAYCY